MSAMPGLIFHDLESLEAITRDDYARRLFVRMAALAQAGHLELFIDELMHDREIGAETKTALVEIAGDPGFLAAIDHYVRSTRIRH
jgi:hypothetical protein